MSDHGEHGEAFPPAPARLDGVSWLALTLCLRRSLARARRSDADVHSLLFAACPDDDRHAGRVINIRALVSWTPPLADETTEFRGEYRLDLGLAERGHLLLAAAQFGGKGLV
jgi:hypothetical protein